VPAALLDCWSGSPREGAWSAGTLFSIALVFLGHSLGSLLSSSSSARDRFPATVRGLRSRRRTGSTLRGAGYGNRMILDYPRRGRAGRGRPAPDRLAQRSPATPARAQRTHTSPHGCGRSRSTRAANRRAASCPLSRPRRGLEPGSTTAAGAILSSRCESRENRRALASVASARGRRRQPRHPRRPACCAQPSQPSAWRTGSHAPYPLLNRTFRLELAAARPRPANGRCSYPQARPEVRGARPGAIRCGRRRRRGVLILSPYILFLQRRVDPSPEWQSRSPRGSGVGC